MALIMGQSTISIRVDEKLKKSFDELCNEMLQIIHEMKSPKPRLLSEPIVRYGKR